MKYLKTAAKKVKVKTVPYTLENKAYIILSH